MYKLLDDLSNITQIPVEDIRKLSSIQQDIVADYIVQSLMEGKNRIDVDVGIGTLSILNDGDIKYRFVGNESFDTKLRSTYIKKKSPLRIRAEKAIYKRLKLCYKELL